jgi:hypothetical protein
VLKGRIAEINSGPLGVYEALTITVMTVEMKEGRRIGA